MKPALFSANSEGACPNRNGAGVRPPTWWPIAPLWPVSTLPTTRAPDHG
ncbi:MAG TPA: hypothetical protein VM677_20350 [Actinokineospora sp.]|nr:hypothetical protein [Actinokineospora sp.]